MAGIVASKVRKARAKSLEQNRKESVAIFNYHQAIINIKLELDSTLSQSRIEF